MKYQNTQQGFTLIEMLVSVSLFAIAATIALGALLVINDAYRRTRAQQIGIDNLNFAIESMTRAIRTGFYYDCSGDNDPEPQSCSATPSSSFSFVDFSGRTIRYHLAVTNGRGSIESCASESGDTTCSNFVPLTSPDVDIDNLHFYVIDAAASAGQPRVVIAMRGIAGVKEKELTPFSVQTTITARN